MKSSFIVVASFILMSMSALSIDKAPFKLSLDQEHFISDKNGVFIPEEIIKLTAGDLIKMYLPDGTCLTGTITKSEFVSKERYECYGESTSHKNANFGFIMAREGIFAGALVMKDTNITYRLWLSVPHKGYILVKDSTPDLNI
jgi:hypothetical protein